LLPYVTDVTPPFGPGLSIWAKITVGPIELCVRSVLVFALNMEIVKRAMPGLGAYSARISSQGGNISMQVKDKHYVTNIFNRVSASVKTVNDKIIAHQQKRAAAEDVIATAALEQLAIQHEILLVLATMVFDPGTGSETLPEPPKKIIGFH
jgi:hypothetical protein